MIDPWSSLRDPALRLLRHISAAFTEDPLRVTRLAARFQPLGFRMADETLALMAEVAGGGELHRLSPERLDLLDSHCLMAREEGVLVSINSDAHSRFDFANLRYGVGQARRGWLEKDDVLNTRPLVKLRPLLKRTM